MLTGKTDPGHLAYFIRLVDLLATCAEVIMKKLSSVW